MADSLGRGYGQLYLSGRSDRIAQLGFISLLDGRQNAYIGLYAGSSRPGGNNTFVGTYSGANASADASVFLGLASGRRATRVKESCFLGYKAGELAERVESSVCVGAYAGRKMTRANCNTLLGHQAGAELTSGSRNTIIGSYAAFQQFNANDNVCVGHRSGYKNQIGSNNVYVGSNAGFAAYAGVENVCLGVLSGEQLYAGEKNVLVGYAAGSRIADASNCIAIGTRAMQYFSSGDTNTCLGTQTARSFSGNNNTILGGYSVQNASGNNNSVIGSNSLNRRNAGPVEIDGCVVLGERVTFDVPVRTVAFTYADTIVGAELTPDPTANVIVLANATPGTGTFVIPLDTAPVGDPLLPDEFRFALGDVTTPIVLDCVSTGSYIFTWGIEIAGLPTYSITGPTRYALTFEISGGGSVTLTLRIDGEITGVLGPFVSASRYRGLSVSSTSGSGMGLSISYHDGALLETYDETTVIVPGAFVFPLEFDALVDNASIVTIEVASAHLVPIGGRIHIRDSGNELLDRVWTVVDVPSADSLCIDADGVIPPGGALILSQSTLIYVTRARVYTAECTYSLADRIVSVTGPHGLHKNDPLSLSDTVDADGIYVVLDTPSPTIARFQLASSGLTLGASPTLTISTFEPSLTYLQVSGTGATKSLRDFVTRIARRSDAEFITGDIVGPYLGDGHAHVGPAGSTNLMNANIRIKQLEFADGGYSYARYTIGNRNTRLVASGSFKVSPLANAHVDFGFDWLASCKLSCVLSSGDLDVRVTKGLAVLVPETLAEISQNVVSTMNGNIQGNSIPLDLANVFLEDEAWVTVGIEETMQTDLAQLRVTIRADGGSAGWKVDLIPPNVTESLIVGLSDVAPPEITGATVRYFANTFMVLRDVNIYNERYRDAPKFENVVYIGSDQVIDNEIDRQDVLIASLGGSQRLLRANIDEFRMYSERAVANTLLLDGIVLVSNLTNPYTATIHGSFPESELREPIGGQALHVLGNARFETGLDVTGALTAASFSGNGAALTNIPISGVSGLQDALDALQTNINTISLTPGPEGPTGPPGPEGPPGPPGP